MLRCRESGMEAGGRALWWRVVRRRSKLAGSSWGAGEEEGWRVRLVGRRACASVLVRAAVPLRCQLSCRLRAREGVHEQSLADWSKAVVVVVVGGAGGGARKRQTQLETAVVGGGGVGGGGGGGVARLKRLAHKWRIGRQGGGQADVQRVHRRVRVSERRSPLSWQANERRGRAC